MLGGSHNFPSSGSSVMLPLSSEDNFQRVEVMICGGAPGDSFQQANAGVSVAVEKTCGRMVITDLDPSWEMEEIQMGRVMEEMLPTGEILINNGAEQGTAGWGFARKPALALFLYIPTAAIGGRFEVLNATMIPRLYHSTAILLPDGRVLVVESNPNVGYSFGSDIIYQTELRMET